MATIVTRSGKGSPLTNAEVDGNFTNLNTELGTKVDASSLATVATTGAYADLTGKPALGTVAAQSADDVAITGGEITGTTMDSISNHVGADHIHYKVKANEVLAKGNVVKVVGYNAGENAFEVAKVTSASDIAVGVVYQPLVSGALGAIINTGLLEGVDTSAFSVGTVLYPNTSGGFTSTKPTTGRYQALAFVVRSNANNGTILIEASEPQATSLSQFTNDSGYITGITSGNVTTALGYTPANISGPTFSNGITVNNGDNQVQIAFDGNLEIVRADGNGYIDFKNTIGEDYDSRIQQIGSGFAMTGTVSAGDEFRAPIFRDTPNTAYFIDPAGTSNISGLTLDGTLAGVTGRFAKNQTAGNYTTAALWTESYGNTATGIAFHISGVVGKFLEMRTDGILYWQGILNADGELRAPIFRDMDNSAYYVDPTGTSNLNKLTASNRSMVGNASIFMDSLDANTYYPVTIPVPVARQTTLRIENALNSNAPSWSTHPSGFSCYIEWTTNGLGWGTIGISRRVTDWREQFNTVQIVGGIDQMTFSSQEVIWLRGGANYFFSADCDVTPTVRTTSYTLNGQTVAPRSSPYNDPWETAQGKMSYGTFQANVRVTAGTDIRAPIFYDSPNTAFYVDPSETSQLKTVEASGGIGFRTFSNGSASINSQFYFANAANSRAWNWQLDENNDAALWNYEGSSWNKRFTFTAGSNFTAGGIVTANVDIRAPIFRDSVNPAYYLDPDSSSVLGGVYSNGQVRATGWWGSQSASATGLGVEIGQNGGRSYVLSYNRDIANYGPMSFEATDFTFTGVGGGFIQVNTSVRAPIFYDTPNTAFYLNPAETSVLSALNVNGSAVYRSDWTTRFQSGSDFVDGTLVTTDIPATAWAGDSFVIEITGKTYDQNNPPVKVVAQGYLYNDTIINYSGISYAGNFASYIKVFEEGGVLKFWWPRISYWNSFNVNVMGMDGPSNNTITRNRVTAISNSTEPTGTKKQQINLTKTLKTGDAAGSISGFNNPTTAPTANTIVYRDGIGDIAAREIILSSGLSTATPTVLVSMFPTTNQMVRTTPTAVAAAIQGAASGTWNIRSADLNQARYANTDFNTLGATPEVFRAYSNYIPSGGSYNQPPNGAGDYKVIQWGGIEGVAGNWGGQIVQNFYDDRMWFRRSFGTTWQAWREFIHDGNYTNYAMPTGSLATNTVEVRAPIFRDNINTGYFIDPDGNSNLSQLMTTGAVVIGGNFTNNGYNSVGSTRLLFGGGNEPDTYFIGTNLENYGGNYTKLDLRWHTGIRMGARPNYGGIRFYNDETLATQIFAIGKDGSYAQANQSMRAPIFQDLDNTAYFINPNDSQSIRTVGDWRADSSAWTGEFAGKIQYHANNWYFQAANQWEFRRSDSANAFSVSQAGVVIALGDMRAPIFYDSPNTGFFVDPSSTSNISGLSVGNRITGSISGDAQRLFNHTGANNDGLQFWNTVGNSTLNPNTGWHYALRLAHGDADTYYNATLAVDFFADNVYLRRKTGGSDQPWKRFALYDNVYEAIFYASSFSDANNTAFYLDPNSTGTSLNVAGSIVAAGNVTAYSDIRIKANVETIPSALDKLDQIRGVTYTRTDLDDKEQRYAGVIAQEIEKVLPEAVRDLGNIKAVDYNATIGLLIQAVKELRDEVEAMKSRLH
jgi:hypothetical protein